MIILGGWHWYVNNSDSEKVESRVVFPAGGEVFEPGTTHRLSWDDPDNIETTTQIFLIDTALESQGASVSVTDRIYGIPDTGSYEYTFPVSIPNGTYKFSIGTLTSKTFQIASSTE